MKTIIAGSRRLTEYALLEKAMELAIKRDGFEISEVVSGCAVGIDSLGMLWAFRHKAKVKRFPANWHRDGLRAGAIRNQAMAQYADALIAIWDGKSPGTKDMIQRAKRYKLKIAIYRAIDVQKFGINANAGT